MKLDDLILLARERMQDEVAPYLVSDDSHTRAANRACREAARRSLTMIDSSTAEICEIAVAAAVSSYDLDRRVLRIRRAKLGDRTVPLRQMDQRDLDEQRPGWEDETGEPEGYVRSMDLSSIRLVPAPTAADTLYLTVARLPLQDLTTGASDVEFPEHTQEALASFMAAEAYARPDPDLRNPGKRAEELDIFEREFGPPVSASEERWREHNAAYLQDAEG